MISTLRIIKTIGLLSLIASSMSAEMLPAFQLKKGVYVTGPETCKTAPNAAMMQWDGHGFSGAHSSKCFTNQIGKGSTPYSLVTRCDALGDGTSASETEEAEQLTLRSPSSFHFAKLDAQGRVIFESDYHWACSKRR